MNKPAPPGAGLFIFREVLPDSADAALAALLANLAAVLAL